MKTKNKEVNKMKYKDQLDLLNDKDIKFNYTCGGWQYYYNVVTGEEYIVRLDGTVQKR